MLLFEERLRGSPEASSSPSADRDGYLIGQWTHLPLNQGVLSCPWAWLGRDGGLALLECTSPTM